MAKRGRTEMDVAIRIRNWGWYWLVKAESGGLSDDRLDDLFAEAPIAERRRHFFQIRSTGSSPDLFNGSKRKGSLYDCVHEDGQFLKAKQWFEAPLWNLLAQPLPNLPALSTWISEVLAQGNWYRSDVQKAHVGHRFLPKQVAFNALTADDYAARILDFTESAPSPLMLTLLCGLHLEARLTFDSAVCLIVEERIFRMVRTAWHGRIPGPLDQLLACVIRQRIFEGRRHTWESAPPEATQGSTRKQRIQNFNNWLMIQPATLYLASNLRGSRIPVVPNSSDLAWFERNREHLSELYGAEQMVKSMTRPGAVQRKRAERNIALEVERLLRVDPLPRPTRSKHRRA